MMNFLKRLIGFALVSHLSYISATPLTVNGRDIREIAKPGEVIVYEMPTINNVVFYLKDGNVQLGSLPNAAIKTDILKKEYEGLLSQRNSLNCLNSKTKLHLTSHDKSIHQGAHLQAEEAIVLKGETVEIAATILQSPHLYLIAKTFTMS